MRYFRETFSSFGKIYVEIIIETLECILEKHRKILKQFTKIFKNL